MKTFFDLIAETKSAPNGKYKAESIEKMSHSQLKFFATKKVPHGSYTRAEVDDEHKRRQKTAGAAYQNAKPSVNERTLTKGEMNKREKLAKDLPDAEFKKRYGKDWMSVKMGTATNLAKKEDVRSDRLAALKKQDDDKKKQDDANLSKVRYATIMKRKGYNEAKDYTVQVTGSDGAGTHKVKAKSQDHAHELVMKKIGQSKLPKHMQPKTRIMGEALDPNNHKHVMSVMYNTKNSEEGIAAIKKKFGVDHKKANDMMDKAIDHQTKNENESVNEISQGMKDRYLRFAKSSRIIAPKDFQRYKALGMPQGMKRAANTARKRDRGIKLASEAMTFAVNVEGLPQMFLNGNSPGEIKQNLRKMFKQPSMIQSVKRVTPHDVKKVFRMKAQGKDED